MGSTHDHIIIDKDPHFIIDPITRAISIESSDKPSKIALMQYDHNSERFSFEIDTSIEGHDMLRTSEVTIHYCNVGSGSNGQRNDDVYKVTDVTLDPDDPNKLLFTWLISENATLYSGTLSFVVIFSCYKNVEVTKVDKDGNEYTEVEKKTIYRWGTDFYNSIGIKAGMNNGEAIVENYSDYLLQWKNEINSLLSDWRDELDAEIVKNEELRESINETKNFINGSLSSYIDTTVNIDTVLRDSEIIKEIYNTHLTNESNIRETRLGNDIIDGSFVTVPYIQSIPEVLSSIDYIPRKITGIKSIGVNFMNVPKTVTVSSNGELQDYTNVKLGDFILDPSVKEYTISFDFEQRINSDSEIAEIALQIRAIDDGDQRCVGYARSELICGHVTYTFELRDGERGVTIKAFSNLNSDRLITDCRFHNILLNRGNTELPYTKYQESLFELPEKLVLHPWDSYDVDNYTLSDSTEVITIKPDNEYEVLSPHDDDEYYFILLHEFKDIYSSDIHIENNMISNNGGIFTAICSDAAMIAGNNRGLYIDFNTCEIKAFLKKSFYDTLPDDVDKYSAGLTDVYNYYGITLDQPFILYYKRNSTITKQMSTVDGKKGYTAWKNGTEYFLIESSDDPENKKLHYEISLRYLLNDGVSKTYVDEKVEGISSPDLSNYYDKGEVDGKIDSITAEDVGAIQKLTKTGFAVAVPLADVAKNAGIVGLVNNPAWSNIDISKEGWLYLKTTGKFYVDYRNANVGVTLDIYDYVVKKALTDNANAPKTGNFTAVYSDADKAIVRELFGIKEVKWVDNTAANLTEVADEDILALEVSQTDEYGFGTSTVIRYDMYNNTKTITAYVGFLNVVTSAIRITRTDIDEMPTPTFRVNKLTSTDDSITAPIVVTKVLIKN